MPAVGDRINMSATPPKQDVEPEGSNSENEKEVMDRPDGTQDQGSYEFEVKEQDRWLPIANGEFFYESLVIAPIRSRQSSFIFSCMFNGRL